MIRRPKSNVDGSNIMKAKIIKKDLRILDKFSIPILEIWWMRTSDHNAPNMIHYRIYVYIDNKEALIRQVNIYHIATESAIPTYNNSGSLPINHSSSKPTIDLTPDILYRKSCNQIPIKTNRTKRII